MVCVHTRTGSVSSAPLCPLHSNLCIPASLFRVVSPFWSQTRPPPTAPSTASDEATPNRTVPHLSLQEVFSTHISLVRNIPLEVAAEITELFRHALQGAIDASENGEAHFTKILLLPAALLSAAKIRYTEAAGARNQTVVNTIKKRIVTWCIDRYIVPWNDAKSLDAPRSFECKTVEFQETCNIRRTIQLAQEGAYRKATMATQSDGILPPSQEVVRALAEMHPQPCPAEEIEHRLPANMPAPLQVLECDVLRATKHFSLGLFTDKKCDRCPAGTRPPVFRPMRPSQLVYDDNAVLEPDNTPPPRPPQNTVPYKVETTSSPVCEMCVQHTSQCVYNIHPNVCVQHTSQCVYNIHPNVCCTHISQTGELVVNSHPDIHQAGCCRPFPTILE